MQAFDPHDDAELYDALPDLPALPASERSGRSRSSSTSKRLQPPTLGGPAINSPEALDAARRADKRARRTTRSADERLLWDTATQLTAGMLANPANANSSVKDALNVFDQFLSELVIYTEMSQSEAPDGPTDIAATSTEPRRMRVAPPALKVRPTSSSNTRQQPRPGDDYRAIPPGMRPGPNERDETSRSA